MAENNAINFIAPISAEYLKKEVQLWRKYAFLAALLLVQANSVAQEIAIPIKKWNCFSVPTNIDSLRKYKDGYDWWTVTSKAGEVYATKLARPDIQLPFRCDKLSSDPHEIARESTAMIVDSGYLVGFNDGYLGGSLCWYSKDGKRNYEIIFSNIVQLIKRNGEIYTVEGVEVSDSSTGSILIVNKKAGKWIAKKYKDLPSVPCAAALDDRNNIVIVTLKSLLSVDLDGNIHTLISNGFWAGSLYPDSIVIEGNIAYIGMHGGVLKYNLQTGRKEWLMP